MNTIRIDFSKKTGKELKPVHGVCNGPICMEGAFNLSRYFAEIGVPYIRLHDTEGAEGRYLVDIHRIFPNFDADENNQENYFFQQTDQLLTAIDKLGAKTIYRLGESIDLTVYKRYARPPKDFEKWTRICLHIIKHYNDGWADGFHFGIKFWEIWNEPDCTEEMWNGGTMEQFFNLYRVAARAIKDYDGSLLIGGPALAWNEDLAKDLISICKKENLPLDFLSYHRYFEYPEDLIERTTNIKKMLLENGFDRTLLVVDEWNYVSTEGKCSKEEMWPLLRSIEGGEYAKIMYEKQKNQFGASFNAACFCVMNEIPIDIATYYDGQTIMRWGGLFDVYTIPQKAYYAFCAYGRMYKNAKDVIDTQCEIKGIYAISSVGEKDAYVLVSNFCADDEYYELELNNLNAKETAATVSYVNKEFNLTPYKTEIYHGESVKQTIYLEKNSVALIEIARK